MGKMATRGEGRERKRREDLEHAKILMKERLMREIELDTLNTKRSRASWREMMMKIKMPQIVEDVEIAWRNFDYVLDVKDHRISFLMDELAEAEEQYQKNARSHIETIDRLLRLYGERMQCEEKKNYREILNEMLDRKDAEVGKIYRQQNESESLIESISHGIQQQQEESLNNIKSVVLSKLESYVQDSKDTRRISTTQLENQLQSLWEDLRRILSDYHNKTKERRARYEAIKEKDEKEQRIIAQQLSHTANLFDEIRKLRSKISTYDATAKKNISEIRTEHDFFQNTYKIVKNRLLAEQAKNKDQLKILSLESNKVIKHLEDLVTKGNRLLMLMQICRKYEYEIEQVIAFIHRTKMDNSLTFSSQQTSVLLNLDEIYQDLENLTNFWQRLGAAQLITMQLQSERDKLRCEAVHLRECIRSYMAKKGKQQISMI